MHCNRSVITSITWCITCSLIHYMLHNMLHYIQHHPITGSITWQLHAQLHVSLYAITSSTISLHVPLHDNYMLNYMLHYILNCIPLHALHGIKFPGPIITCFLHSLPHPGSTPPLVQLVLKIIVFGCYDWWGACSRGSSSALNIKTHG